MLSTSRCLGRRMVMASRSMSSIPLSLEETDPDYIVFPRERPGLSYDLNWSLTDDGIAPRGDAYRNASLKELLMFSSGSASLKSKTVSVPGDAVPAPSLATDVYPGLDTMSIDQYEETMEEVTGSMSNACRLFVEDAAVGASRDAEVRVRVISDSADYALVMRNLLARTPLYSPEAFPRPIVVYISTASPDSYTALDFDPEAARASIIVSGTPSIAQVRQQIAFSAGLLMDQGGYRHIRGGGPRVQLARDDGNPEWYFDDRYNVADADTAHPDLLLLSSVDTVVKGDSVSLVVDGSGHGDNVFAAHNVIWTENGLSRAWDGASTGASSDTPGAITFQGLTTASVGSSAFSTSHPSKIVYTGAASDLPGKLGLNESQAAKLDARLEAHGVVVGK